MSMFFRGTLGFFRKGFEIHEAHQVYNAYLGRWRYRSNTVLPESYLKNIATTVYSLGV